MRLLAGEWTEYILWQDGEFVREHCLFFPKTCYHISKALLVRACQPSLDLRSSLPVCVSMTFPG